MTRPRASVGQLIPISSLLGTVMRFARLTALTIVLGGTLLSSPASSSSTAAAAPAHITISAVNATCDNGHGKARIFPTDDDRIGNEISFGIRRPGEDQFDVVMRHTHSATQKLEPIELGAEEQWEVVAWLTTAPKKRYTQILTITRPPADYCVLAPRRVEWNGRVFPARVQVNQPCPPQVANATHKYAKRWTDWWLRGTGKKPANMGNLTIGLVHGKKLVVKPTTLNGQPLWIHYLGDYHLTNQVALKNPGRMFAMIDAMPDAKFRIAATTGCESRDGD